MNQHCFMYGDEKITFDLYKMEDRKGKIAIHVHPNARVQVDAPANASINKVMEAVHKRARWIIKNVTEAKERSAHILPRSYVSGESHFYLGKRYKLKVERIQRSFANVKMTRGNLHIQSSSKNAEHVKKLLVKWYRNRAGIVFQKRMEEISRQIVWLDSVPVFKLRTMQKQWGSCSSSGTILLNPHLVKAPRECIDYVLLHEICHLKEHNHSTKYYKLLYEVMPNWKQVKSKLDGMAELLLND